MLWYAMLNGKKQFKISLNIGFHYSFSKFIIVDIIIEFTIKIDVN